ncbi:2-phosphoxylose phosphatase 1 isoform X2 [Pleurodeles waltl]|uniref:2-phosphoxylose phosphatase 1 isoform X2 n=1 Tax=Pleurodeles waltl TaxID=8319 RepID=UPI0037094087
MLLRNRFLFLLALAALLAFLSLSLQFLHLIPVALVKEDGLTAKNRKRIMPDLLTEPSGVDPLYEAHMHCNSPSATEHSMEGRVPHNFKLLSVHILIRHGDRYPLYSIPRTKRPDISCTLSISREPFHHHLEAFISHMAKGSEGHMDGFLSSLPRYPSHALCEMGELTQTDHTTRCLCADCAIRSVFRRVRVGSVGIEEIDQLCKFHLYCTKMTMSDLFCMHCAQQIAFLHDEYEKYCRCYLTIFVAIPTPASVLLQIFNSTKKDGGVQESDALTHFTPYEYCVVQHLKNGQVLRENYLKKHKLLPSNWTAKHLYIESTGKSRTLQSGLALLYSLLPKFDWKKINIRQQWSTIFCAGSCDCPMRNHYLEEEQRRQYNFRVKSGQLERTFVEMAKVVGVPTRQLRASNPIDSLLCHFCHNISFPCTTNGCISMEHFKVIKSFQLEDEKESQKKQLYYKYSLMATYPLLNQTVMRMQRIAQGRKDEVLVLYSGHDVTLSPVLSALGVTEARFPRFAARLVFELWVNGDKIGEHFVRILYNGEDVTFQTSFCRRKSQQFGQSMCPLETFAKFVKRDMFNIFNTTNYYDACHRRAF